MVYQRAVPVVQAMIVVCPPYQARRLRCQRVLVAVATAARVGSRSPLSAGRPRRCLPAAVERDGGSAKSRASKRKGAINVMPFACARKPNAITLYAPSPMK